jgi:hypothetical protein
MPQKICPMAGLNVRSSSEEDEDVEMKEWENAQARRGGLASEAHSPGPEVSRTPMIRVYLISNDGALHRTSPTKQDQVRRLF